jgi:glycine cleavage system aminomethyltransferase T
MREGELIIYKGLQVGKITSGSMSPIRREGIGLGLVELAKLSQPLEKDMIFMLESAGKQREAFLTQTPFVATARVKGAVNEKDQKKLWQVAKKQA